MKEALNWILGEKNEDWWRWQGTSQRSPEQSRAAGQRPCLRSSACLENQEACSKLWDIEKKKLSSFYHDVFINVICSLYQGKSMNFAFYYHFIDEEMRVYKVKEVGPSKELDWASRDLFNPWFWCQLVTAFENQASIFFFHSRLYYSSMGQWVKWGSGRSDWAALAASCRLGSGLLHESLMLFGPADHVGHLPTEIWQGTRRELRGASACPAFTVSQLTAHQWSK